MTGFGGRLTEAGPLVQLQISLSRVPLRIAPAWSALAGALAVAPALGDPAVWLRIVAAVVLADLAWGVLRQYAQARPETEGQGAVFVLPLPYAQPAAPMSRLLGSLTYGGATWHGAVAGVVLTLGGGLLLGWPAVGLSLIAILLTALAGPLARRGDAPAAPFALLDVLLPWTLGMFAAGWASGNGLTWPPLVVAAALTLLQWGAARATASGHGATRALPFGALAVVVALVALQMPGAAALSAALMVPPLWWLARGDSAAAFGHARTGWAGPWLMLTLFVAALALR
jgi:hypothetical protein